jgi:predicted GIY-YIG superfamily endonuclease
MILERRSASGEIRYGVRISVDGKKTWIGTFDTREAAEEAECAGSKPKRRLCVKCQKPFRPNDDRHLRCPRCVSAAKKKHEKVEDDHWLYFCHDAEGELLYIGITSSGIRRMRVHGDQKNWWKDVDTITLRHFETRGEAVAAEQIAVRDLGPRYNVRLQKKEREWPEGVIPFPGAHG